MGFANDDQERHKDRCLAAKMSIDGLSKYPITFANLDSDGWVSSEA